MKVWSIVGAVIGAASVSFAQDLCADESCCTTCCDAAAETTAGSIINTTSCHFGCSNASHPCGDDVSCELGQIFLEESIDFFEGAFICCSAEGDLGFAADEETASEGCGANTPTPTLAPAGEDFCVSEACCLDCCSIAGELNLGIDENACERGCSLTAVCGDDTHPDSCEVGQAFFSASVSETNFGFACCSADNSVGLAGDAATAEGQCLGGDVVTPAPTPEEDIFCVSEACCLDCCSLAHELDIGVDENACEEGCSLGAVCRGANADSCELGQAFFSDGVVETAFGFACCSADNLVGLADTAEVAEGECLGEIAVTPAPTEKSDFCVDFACCVNCCEVAFDQGLNVDVNDCEAECANPSATCATGDDSCLAAQIFMGGELDFINDFNAFVCCSAGGQLGVDPDESVALNECQESVITDPPVATTPTPQPTTGTQPTTNPESDFCTDTGCCISCCEVGFDQGLGLNVQTCESECTSPSTLCSAANAASCEAAQVFLGGEAVDTTHFGFLCCSASGHVGQSDSSLGDASSQCTEVIATDPPVPSGQSEDDSGGSDTALIVTLVIVFLLLGGAFGWYFLSYRKKGTGGNVEEIEVTPGSRPPMGGDKVKSSVNQMFDEDAIEEIPDADAKGAEAPATPKSKKPHVAKSRASSKQGSMQHYTGMVI